MFYERTVNKKIIQDIRGFFPSSLEGLWLFQFEQIAKCVRFSSKPYRRATKIEDETSFRSLISSITDSNHRKLQFFSCGQEIRKFWFHLQNTTFTKRRVSYQTYKFPRWAEARTGRTANGIYSSRPMKELAVLVNAGIKKTLQQLHLTNRGVKQLKYLSTRCH